MYVCTYITQKRICTPVVTIGSHNVTRRVGCHCSIDSRLFSCAGMIAKVHLLITKASAKEKGYVRVGYAYTHCRVNVDYTVRI